MKHERTMFQKRQQVRTYGSVIQEDIALGKAGLWKIHFIQVSERHFASVNSGSYLLLVPLFERLDNWGRRLRGGGFSCLYSCWPRGRGLACLYRCGTRGFGGFWWIRPPPIALSFLSKTSFSRNS